MFNRKEKYEFKSLMKLAGPAMIAQLAQIALLVSDTIMTGHYNKTAQATVGTAINVLNIFLVLGIGLLLALSPIAAQANGRKNYTEVNLATQNGIYLAILIGLPCVIALRSCEIFFHWFGIAENIIPIADGYLKATSWGIIPFFLFLALRFANEGIFQNKAVMYCSLTAIPLNILFNSIFMFGFLGGPELGAIGTGYATSLVWTCMFLYMLCFTLKSKAHDPFGTLKKWFKPQWKMLKEILLIGTPIAVSITMEITLFSVVGLYIAKISEDAIAAHQIAINIVSVLFMLPLGISLALTSRVGFAVGRKSHRSVKRACRIGLLTAAAFVAVNLILLLGFTQAIVSVYTQDAMVLFIAAKLLIYGAIFQLSDSMQVATAGALRGLKDTRFPMVVCGIAYWVIGLPVGFLAAITFEQGVYGYWIGLIAGLTAAGIMLSWRLYQQVHYKKYQY